MRLDEPACLQRLGRAGHGVLATRHDRRGVDAVPVVYAVVGDAIAMPVDVVKPKAHTRLQRLANLESDDRCVLLVDHYDDDWSRLWWVRVHGRASTGAPGDDVVRALAEHFPAYRRPGSVVGAVLLTPTEVRGWAAG